jgi:hypothetical protein
VEGAVATTPAVDAEEEDAVAAALAVAATLGVTVAMVNVPPVNCVARRATRF